MGARQSRLPEVDDETSSIPSAERNLMIAVLANAIRDARGTCPDHAYRTRAKAEALEWISTAGPDFQLVCQIAGFDPAKVRRAALIYAEATEGQRLKSFDVIAAEQHERLAA